MFEDRPRAKINLTLEIVGRRPDGYHELRSRFLRVGLTDRLTMQPGGADGTDTLMVSGLDDLPVKDNLVLRAVQALRAHVGIKLPALDIALDKRIPVAAGLGGGSSDCASALKLAQACWGVGVSEADELALAAELGSDVPFFSAGHAAAVATGRGEHLEPVEPPVESGVLLVTPLARLSTPRVFARYDDLGKEHDESGNDLWPAAASLEPSLVELRTALTEATQLEWRMSGSGPTLFALYPAVTEAADAGRALVQSRLAVLDGSQINAVDLVGPDPAWRFP
ncbi:MAG: 4-(cytidine 5'-diphospho)-2-C-methyl-D-erythritol kinase [Candidatus Limnocylindrales bacterium]